ncbi:sulfurtransferase TusA family protein [Fodinicurvata sp. EGI_FJ10296]|uniref:sulfurtransferase TusA family protein n=1 Tax=Fodinicurvata sp. EGI_FJ10296 TaxID=3231908 RepID=UPI00345491AB
MKKNPDYTVDITQEVCPFTFIRTKLVLERMKTGEILHVRLKGEEPLENVPKAVREMGSTILSLEPEPESDTEGVKILSIEKGSAR